ncbi:MAG TPA: 30S ribosomal protein S20 [Candidatus Hydrogenedentes bacterium]|jgi:small subunit ribosomal protein S20|nr:30S ribosomal protein S20 [Candidatus Hydrogenedentota bacterium]MDY0031913.1 30S ribosomal protein S20 [FCB group bacterium]NLT59962.1 30S ribosomal protein S20 [Candidatus Hydrogenedentota bacterium]HNV23020.1 30S ribosomal protein S20 [Candidatus Hydrogenedentota bacterium]HNZ16926.1 30S ribosomal protein S20 [Candidatus Hydrogenedentota bacterium]
MASSKSAKKRIRTSERDRQQNQAVRSKVRTYIKNVLAAVDAKDEAKVKELAPAALSEIDKAASNRVLHPNNAARKKSRLQRHIAAMKP